MSAAKRPIQVIMSFENYLVIGDGFESAQLPIWTKPNGEQYVIYKRRQYKVKNWGSSACPNYIVEID